MSLSIKTIVNKVRNRELSAVDAVRNCISFINEKDPEIHAFICVSEELAFRMAEDVDERIKRGEGNKLPLAGVPVAIKDNINVRGLPTTCCSRILEGYTATYNATAVERLVAAGAVIVGKTNMDEFAFGSSTENSAFGITRNPLAPERVPGGSSGGSASAVAAGMVPVALGSDTGGSVRQPASFTGTVGFKPTYGRVSRYGLVAFASSLDQIGTIARTVEDCAMVTEVIAGWDEKDSTSLREPVGELSRNLKTELGGLRIGVPVEYFSAGLEPGVSSAVWKALEKCKSLGATVQEISLPMTEYAVPVYYLIAMAEASSNLARYDGIRYGRRAANVRELGELYYRTRGEGFGFEARRRILLGTYILSSGYYDRYYLRAQKARTLIRQDFRKAFEQVDIVATPATPTTAFKIGEKTSDPLTMYLSDICTISTNLAGLPAISIPCGFSNSLPVGLQLIAPPLCERLVFDTAHAVEKALDTESEPEKGREAGR